MVKRSVDQIHAQNAHGFLLLQVCGVLQIDVQDGVACRASRLLLESYADPAVRLVGSGEIPGGDRVHKRKKLGRRSPGSLQFRQQLLPLALHHGLQALLRNVTRAFAVEVVAHFLVVRGNRFCHRPGRSAHDQEPSRHFLARADFRERAEFRSVQIDRKRLLVCSYFIFGRHVFTHARKLYPLVTREATRQ